MKSSSIILARFISALILLAFLLASCGIVPFDAGSAGLPLALMNTRSPVIVFAPADATATATPFQPLPVTPTYLPAEIATATPALTNTPEPPASIPAQERTWADYPGPTIWPDVEIPAPAGLLAQPAGQVNILLLGSDQRPYDGGFRTDTILLLTLNPKAGTVNLTSFPRDLYVYIPGWTVQRINTAFAHGGFDLLALTMEYNFGVRPDHYAMINFSSFEQVIDRLGGVNVKVAETLTDHRDGYGSYTVFAGTRSMNGATALWYVRARYTTNDFARGRRQQEVLLAAFEKLLSLDGLKRAPELYQVYRSNVTTDMSFEQMAQFLPLASQLNDMTRIHRYFISPAEVYPMVNTYGAQVLLPIREACLVVMRQALNTP